MTNSQLFFPLRTGVELFEDRTSPAAVARAKQASILYDELIFEDGLYEVSITPQGSSGWWTPPGWLTDEHLEQSRRVQPSGTTFTFSMGPQGEEQMTQFINAPLTVDYASEYHTGILDDLQSRGVDWIKQVSTGDRLPKSTAEGKLAHERELRDRFDHDLLSELRPNETFLRRWIIENFHRDSVLSAAQGASFSLTSLFVPMLEHHGLKPTTGGQTALQVVVPDLSSLPWDGIIEFRNHAGSEEARTMLRTFDEKASQEEPGDALAYFSRVSQQVNDAVFAAYDDLRPSWPRSISEQVSAFVVSLDPNLGPLVSSTLTGAGLLRDRFKYRNSWVSAVMVLKKWGGGPLP